MIITLTEWVLRVAGIAFWINLLIMFPLSFINKTKAFSANWMFVLSMVMLFGIWAGSAVYTFMAWGIIPLIIGILIYSIIIRLFLDEKHFCRRTGGMIDF